MKKKSISSLALNKKLISNLTNRANSLMGGTGTMGPHPDPPTTESGLIICIPDEPGTSNCPITYGSILCPIPGSLTCSDTF